MLDYLGPLILIIFFGLSAFIFKGIFQSNLKYTLAVILLLGVLLRLFIGGDMFLHEWDERFHALVAKHLVETPLTPRLYEEVLIDYDFKDWSRNNIWLSKPILPLWVMATSISIFGVNEIGVRLFFIIISLFSVVLTYKIGCDLFSKKVGLIAAFLHSIHGLILEFVGGLVSSDHIDTLFLFMFELTVYFTLSNRVSKYRQTIFLGVCIGLAFLTKWSMAVILFLTIAGILFSKKGRTIDVVNFLIGTLVLAILVCLPWVIYIRFHFPLEASYILRQIIFPIQEVIQGHKGGVLFYFDKIRILFGEVIYLPLVWLVYRGVKSKEHAELSLLLWIAIPVLLLSISETKRMTYIMVSAPAFFIVMGLFIEYLQKEATLVNYKISKIIVMVLLLGLPMRYSLERIKPFKERGIYPEWRTNLSKLKDDNFDKKIVLYNEPNNINAMFYYDFIAYNKNLSLEELERIKSKGWTVFENITGMYVAR